MGFIIFVFGIGAGFLTAFFWSDFFGGTLSTVISIFIVSLVVLAGLVILFFVFRRRILNYLFNVTQTHLASFAEPLADVTRHAMQKDADGATAAARRLVQLSLARYAWISTRRWIMASLTALIAAMAALGGTALLFRQNQLLADQSVLLRGQNERLAEQNRLIGLDINLAEAARNAELVVEISNIADELGKTVKRLRKEERAKQPPDTPQRIADYLPLIPDPMRQLDPGLVARIVSASLATRPYRFLSKDADPRDQNERLRTAFSTRPDLKKAIQAMERQHGVRPLHARADLIERPISPERGHLMAVLFKAGIHNIEWLNFNGLDLSFAKVEIDLISHTTFHKAKLSFADFSYVEVGGCNFGGATLDNAWFKKSVIFDSSFASVDGQKVPEPYKKSNSLATTFVSGADFSGSAILRTRFDQANVAAGRFDDAVLSDVTFRQASIGGSTFRKSVLIDVDFTGALLHSVEFDGAIVFDKEFLAKLATISAPKSFRPERFEIAPVDSSEIYKNPAAYAHIGVRISVDKVSGKQAYRIKRIGAFEQ